ncbi:hypothetical protein BU23DRAFT_598579 [Bimuria novae-zelandiae CBS 107.79]|uniref:Uncharacterized protein n=1 Tax=Bimuria novae-zelandiae CBS 107.79 TaxID=1447943 RepID=A0A6A5VC91_9PLEO|nr:hypothetical protein BU23DRAFT_598579 [Bimuria novae-zelandiae CBS 107.79]
MGNVQSNGQHHNRLVKPKTNTNSPSPAPDAGPNVDSPVSLSSRYANLSSEDRQQIKSQLLSPMQTDFGFRESLDGEENPEEIAAKVNRRLSSRSNSLSCFGSKAGSTARLSSLPPSNVSLVPSNRPVDLETAISILQEVQKNASPEDIAALQQALQPYAPGPSPGSTNTTEPGLSRRTSVSNRSASSLTRRRSLLATPGVATRNSPVESNRRTWNSWRTPQLGSQEKAKWQPQEKKISSPLTRTAATDAATEERESPVPRAQTPADMEYSHLGALKLGSLRIANGEPSPDVGTKLNWYVSQSASHEDYFSPSMDSGIMMKPTARRRHVRSKSAVQPPTPPLYRNLRVSDDARKAKTTSRYSMSPNPDVPEQPQQCQQLQQPHYEEEELESEPVRRLRVMNKSQDTLATMHPTISNEPCVPPVDVPTEDHDEGFASNDAVCFREEAIRILDGTIFGEPAPVERSSIEAPTVRTTSSSSMRPRANRRPPPKKADSGYSSGGSFKTKHGESWKANRDSTAYKAHTTTTVLRQSNGDRSEEGDSTSLYSFEQMIQVSTSQRPLPTAAADEHVASHNMHRYRSYENVKKPLTVNTQLPEDWNIDDLSLSTRVSKTPKTPTSFVSQFSNGSKISAHKLLNKRRPSFQVVPVVQSCDPIPEGTIPTIPTDISMQFARRLSETPGLECLTQTYPTKDHVNNEESEPELPSLKPIKFPSPPATPEPQTRGRHHRRAATERPSSPRRGLRRSLSLFRRKTKAEKTEEQPPLPDAATVHNLGTTAASLGRSPYDVALAAAHQKRVVSPTHPYQVGDAMPSTKPRGNMDAKTAVKLARLRSKDHTQLRPTMPPRPRSYYSEREATSDANIYRRHSFYGHAPPMPTIPSIWDLGAANRCAEKQPQPQPPVPEPLPTETTAGPGFRARSIGRGRVVTPLIEKYDYYSHHASTAAEGGMTYEQLNEAARANAGRSYSMGGRNVRKQVNHPDWR